ncbi:putative holin-like toxin [Sporolactobacillus sp. STCC-11]
MTVFEAMTLMISFGVLILMLSDRQKEIIRLICS